MHELGIAESALSAALKEMESHGARKILSVTLRIGDLAAVDPEALQFAFRSISPNTPAEEARLMIEHVNTIAWCSTCGEEFTTTDKAFFTCPRCRNFSSQLRSGREIELARLELDK